MTRAHRMSDDINPRDAARTFGARVQRINLSLTRYLQQRPHASAITLSASDYDFVLRCIGSTVDSVQGLMYNWRVHTDRVTYRGTTINRGSSL